MTLHYMLGTACLAIALRIHAAKLEWHHESLRPQRNRGSLARLTPGHCKKGSLKGGPPYRTIGPRRACHGRRAPYIFRGAPTRSTVGACNGVYRRVIFAGAPNLKISLQKPHFEKTEGCSPMKKLVVQVHDDPLYDRGAPFCFRKWFA